MNMSHKILLLLLIAQGAVGQTYVADCGAFSYPGSGQYDDNEDRTFLVSPAPAGAREFVFTKFDVEATYDIVYASVLQNGQYVPVGQWSGSAPAAPIVAPEGGFSIRFTSDSSVTYTGFSVMWYRPGTLRGEPSNETIACNSFSTVEYPVGGGEYGNNENVEIVLEAELGPPKAFAFTRFDIEANNDWLNVYVWEDGAYRHHRSYTGRSPPGSFVAPEGRAKAVFTSNGSVVGTGFKALVYNA